MYYLKYFLSRVLQWILPTQCIICHAEAQRDIDLCCHCQQDLPLLINCCRTCAAPLASTRMSLFCGRCQRHPPPYQRLCALFHYQGVIRDFIKDIKFYRKLSCLQVLGRLLSIAVTQHWYQTEPLPCLLIPIPLHRHRLRERGFNQALELAKIVTKQTQAIALGSQALRRDKPTLAQSDLPAAKRYRNIRGAFVGAPVGVKHVALLDDVVTTGATVSEATRVLHDHGVERVDVWCVAKSYHSLAAEKTKK